MKNKPEFQYYYRTSECRASDADDKMCICWHEEGTGPFENERHNSEVQIVCWRVKQARRTG